MTPRGHNPSSSSRVSIYYTFTIKYYVPIGTAVVQLCVQLYACGAAADRRNENVLSVIHVGPS